MLFTSTAIETGFEDREPKSYRDILSVSSLIDAVSKLSSIRGLAADHSSSHRNGIGHGTCGEDDKIL